MLTNMQAWPCPENKLWVTGGNIVHYTHEELCLSIFQCHAWVFILKICHINLTGLSSIRWIFMSCRKDTKRYTSHCRCLGQWEEVTAKISPSVGVIHLRLKHASIIFFITHLLLHLLHKGVVCRGKVITQQREDIGPTTLRGSTMDQLEHKYNQKMIICMCNLCGDDNWKSCSVNTCVKGTIRGDALIL